MNLKTIFATGALALLPLAAQAEMAPMADAELRAVQAKALSWMPHFRSSSGWPIWRSSTSST